MPLVSVIPAPYPLFISGLGGITADMNPEALKLYLVNQGLIPSTVDKFSLGSLVDSLYVNYMVVKGENLRALSDEQIDQALKPMIEGYIGREKAGNSIERTFRLLTGEGWLIVPRLAPTTGGTPPTKAASTQAAQAAGRPAESVFDIYRSWQRYMDQTSSRKPQIQPVSRTAAARPQQFRSAVQTQKPIWPWILLGLGVTIAGVALYFTVATPKSEE